MVLFVVAITSVVAILGHRRWQSRIASEILSGRGLSEAEVIVHMATVKQTRALPLFASATQLAGLDAGEVQSSSDIELAEKEAELQSIYGGENTADLGFASNSGYSQAPQMSAGSISSAAEASALLEEDAGSAPQPIQNEAPKALVESGGIALPAGVSSTRPVVVEQQVSAAATDLKCVCESCGAGFEITLPAGVPKAVVACPSCQVDNLIGA